MASATHVDIDIMLILPSSVRAACNDAELYRNIMCGVTRLKLYHNVQDCQVVKIFAISLPGRSFEVDKEQVTQPNVE